MIDWKITLGTIIEVALLLVGGLAGWYAFKSWMSIELNSFRGDLRQHAMSLSSLGEDLKALAGRLGKHEDRLVDVMGELNRLIGRMDANRLNRE